jgi:hypothetical protein
MLSMHLSLISCISRVEIVSGLAHAYTEHVSLLYTIYIIFDLINFVFGPDPFLCADVGGAEPAELIVLPGFDLIELGEAHGLILRLMLHYELLDQIRRWLL